MTKRKYEQMNPWLLIILLTVTCVVITIVISNLENRPQEIQDEQYTIISQTLDAKNLRAPTQEILDEINGCIGIDDTFRYVGTSQCVVGLIYTSVEDPNNDPSDPLEPQFNYSYFSAMPNTFYLYLQDDYLLPGECVKAWGEIQKDKNGTPVMQLFLDREGITVKTLPRGACKP